MKKVHEGMMGSLRRFCRSAGVPEERVVVGGSGVIGALGLRQLGSLEVWCDPLAFELFAGRYNGVVPGKDGAKTMESWAPFGALVTHTGPWIVGQEDFGGMKEASARDGFLFLHWSPEKTLRWLRATQDVLGARLLERERCSCGSWDQPEVPYGGGWPACPGCGRV
jgi:hypothetical protein